MKNLLTFAGIFICFYFLNAQKKETSFCVSDYLHLQQLEKDNTYRENFELTSQNWEKYAISKLNNPPGMVYPVNNITLNIAFHDISGGNNLLNISNMSGYETITEQLNIIFNSTNISFCVARQDVNGDAYEFDETRTNNPVSSNLDRTVNSHITSIVNEAYIRFPTSNFLNIYIVDNIVGNTAGFAYMPSSHGIETDGIYLERFFLDSSNSSFTDNIKVLVHEIGHYLGLFHTFGICNTNAQFEECSCNDNNCWFNGDMVCDTPPHQNPELPMLELSNLCDSTNDTCTSDSETDPFNNYMNYTPQSCQVEFTDGQIMRMQFMLNPDFGPRKSLLDVETCVSCDMLDECVFSISSSLPLETPRHYIEQNQVVSFNAINNCSNANIDYTWTLIDTDYATIVAEYNATTPVSTSGLAVGNYQLTLTSTSTIDSNCFKTENYYFTIINSYSNCIPELPIDNSSWEASNWSRISFSGGNWIEPSSGDEDATLDSQGFDIIPIYPGGNITSDANFTTISLPVNANIDKIMRVGRPWMGGGNASGGGRAHYVQRTINITPENSRFRIWYLGGTDTPSNHSFNSYNNFYHSTLGYGPAAFGWFCEYNYNSTVFNNSSTTLNSTIGTNYNSTAIRNYNVNDMISLRHNDHISSYSENNEGFNLATEWQFHDLDFSEFATLNPNTEITITFFEHSNHATDALQNAYAYFGIECLGGGIPESFLPNFPDVSVPCQNSIVNEISYELPIPNYAKNTSIQLSMIDLPGYFHFYDFTLEIQDANGNYPTLSSFDSTYEYTINYIDDSFSIMIDANATDYYGNNYNSPFRTFRITYTTLNGTFVDEFSVFLGFNTVPSVCITGDSIDNSFYNPDLINGKFYFCDSSEDFIKTLHLTDSCIETDPELYFEGYQWYYNYSLEGANFFPILGQTNSVLNISSVDNVFTEQYDLPDSFYQMSFKRATKYTNAYCSTNTLEKYSDTFTIYNLNKVGFGKNNVSTNDICYTHSTIDEISVYITRARIYRPQIAIPDHFNLDFENNTFTFQLFDPQSNQLIGDPYTYNFSGQITGHLYTQMSGLPQGDLSFVFTNENPLDSSSPLFHPTTPNQMFELQLQITGTYGGCEISPIIIDLTTITMTPTAAGGRIIYDCDNQQLLNDNSMTNWSLNNIYGWEYKDNSGNFISIIDAPNTDELPILDSYYNLATPLIIRRVSYGANNCPGDDYSNEITITPPPEIPSMIITQPSCFIATGTIELSDLPIGNWTLNELYNGNVSNTYSGSETSFIIENLTAGSYEYILTNDYPCDSEVFSVDIQNHSSLPASPTVSINCSGTVGSITITSPLGANYNYSLDNINYQSSPNFNNLLTGNYTVYVYDTSTIDCISNSLVHVVCSCTDPTTLQLGTYTDSICGLTPITVTGNSFGGSATNVNISTNGAGSVSPSSTNNNNFEFTYTPTSEDIGQTVQVTVTTNNPLSLPCIASTLVCNLSINEITEDISSVINQPTCTSATGSISFNGLPNNWTITSVTDSWGSVSGSESTHTFYDLPEGTYGFTVTDNSDCNPLLIENLVVNSQPITPNAPLIDASIHANCNTPTGSIMLSGLPNSGSWIITATNGSATFTESGTGSAYIFNSLEPGNYTFTVTHNGCTSEVSEAEIIDVLPIAIPKFDLPDILCGTDPTPDLPLTDLNGIIGTWNPSVFDTNISSYVFTPADGQCAEEYIYKVIYNITCDIFLEWSSDVSCQEGTEGKKWPFEDIIDSNCIRVCENSTINYAITGGNAGITNTEWNVLGGTIVNQTTTSCTINWNSVSVSHLNIVINYQDGNHRTLDVCIEKLNAPKALFSIESPFEGKIKVCKNTPVNFNNLTIDNEGHESIYYNWDFGDGNTSNEFEPIHIYENEGSYTVTLSAFNGCSCIGEYKMKIIVKSSELDIQCPSIVCEGDIAKYYINSRLSECEPEWIIEGGEIVWMNNDKTEINVLWNNINTEGFGYVSVKAERCFECEATIKIPVILNKTKILGDTTICEKSQNLYSLPQWATTDFQWELQDTDNTGAELFMTMNRNEIIIQATAPGVVVLNCNYYNTLLGCGGSSKIKISVIPEIKIANTDPICINESVFLEFETLDGNSVSEVLDWEIHGPNNYFASGSGSEINNTFYEAGLYAFYISSSNYCYDNIQTIKIIEVPSAPVAIIGEDLSICPGIPIDYSINTPEGFSVNWSVSGGTILGADIGDSITVNFDPNHTNPYIVNVWYEFEGCKSVLYSAIINVDEPDLTPPNGAKQVCGSSFEVYDINEMDVDNYIWSINPEYAGSVQMGQNTNEVQILWNQPDNTTTASVVLTVRKCGKNYVTKLENIEILASPQLTNTSPLNTCVGENFTASFDIQTDFIIQEVVWDFGDNTPRVNNNTTSATHVYHELINESTNLTVTATVTTQCGNATVLSFPVVISPSPIVDVTPLGVNFCNITTPEVDLAITQQGGFASTDQIQWFMDDVSIPGETNPILTITNNGINHTYKATVTNDFGCTKSTTQVNTYDCPGIGIECASEVSLENNYLGCQSIMVFPTAIPNTPLESFWSSLEMPLDAVVTSSGNALIIDNLEVGTHMLTFFSTYMQDEEVCTRYDDIYVTIPYASDLKYDVVCNTDNTYMVTLLDHSVYHPDTEYTHVAFTIDGGNNWIPATTSNNIAQLTVNLYANTIHQIGIKVWSNNYPPCETIINLDLPLKPDASFTINTNGCQNEAVEFVPNVIDSNLQYYWDFGDNTSNLQPVAYRVYEEATSYLATLTVTNSIGCSSSTSTRFPIIAENIDGTLLTLPNNACEWDSVTINYTPYPGSDTVTDFVWYHNTVTETPFAVTTTPSITVTENGQYFIYATNANGCQDFEVKPTSVAFTPPPVAPEIRGTTSVCMDSGEPIVLSVPDSNTLYYNWVLNGVPQSEWDGSNEISWIPTSIGDYEFELNVTTNDSVSCQGTTSSTYIVTVYEALEKPEINITDINCEPYQVTLNISNPSPNVNYYWSNGSTGTEAVITHDGPIQVRAEANGCIAYNQIDLPVDLTKLDWSFPRGCYNFCDTKVKEYHSIIGPFGAYDNWIWLKNYNSISEGYGEIIPLNSIVLDNSYQLVLTNESCDLLLENAEIIQNKDCNRCDFEMNIEYIEPTTINGISAYAVGFVINNLTPHNLSVHLNAPHIEGYFVASTHLLQPETNFIETYFLPLNGFTGGDVVCSIEATTFDDKVCTTQYEFNFPAIIPNRNLNNIMLISPNPTDGLVQVAYELENDGGSKLHVANLLGTVFVKKDLKKRHDTVSLDCSGLPSGFYVVSILRDRKVLTQSKLIIDK